MATTVSELQKVLGQVAKDVDKLENREWKSLLALCDTIWTFDKRYDLKKVGKPCEGKLHARFDEGMLGKLNKLHQRPTLQKLRSSGVEAFRS